METVRERVCVCVSAIRQTSAVYRFGPGGLEHFRLFNHRTRGPLGTSADVNLQGEIRGGKSVVPQNILYTKGWVGVTPHVTFREGCGSGSHMGTSHPNEIVVNE